MRYMRIKKNPPHDGVGDDGINTTGTTLGVMGTSRNEQRLLIAGGLALAALVLWKSQKKSR